MSQQGSILAADFGSVTTRTLLIDVVDGEYRVVARGAGRTTVGYPKNDVSIGLQRIVQGVMGVEDRVLFDDNLHVITPENADREGVDYFITTASAGRPMRVAIIGLMPDVSIATALRAMSGTYIKVVATLSLLDEMDEEERLNAITLSRPDLIFITGGTDGGATDSLAELLRLVQLALMLTDKILRPAVLYAGNAALQAQVQEMFSSLTHVFVADNIRPTMQQEKLESVLLELGRAFDDYKERHSTSFAEINSTTGLLPTAQSYGVIAAYFARLMGTNVMAADMGAANSILVGVFHGQANTYIDTTLGLGNSARSLLANVGVQAIQRWLPFDVTERELTNYALNKTLRPATIPMNLREMYIEHALLRAGLRQMLLRARPEWRGVPPDGALPDVGLILAGGAPLTGTGVPFFDMLLIADALQPTGVTQIKTDPHGLIPALGAMAQIRPEVVVQLLANDRNLVQLGTLINLSGEIQPDSPIANLKVMAEDGQTVQTKIIGGHLLSLPLPISETLSLQIDCGRGVSIGGQRRLKLQVSGGAAGILIDARGRPLALPQRVRQRAAMMPQWVHEATDDPLQAIPAEWITEVDPAQESALADADAALSALLDSTMEPAAETGKRRGRRRGKQQAEASAPETQRSADDANDAEQEDLFGVADDGEVDFDALADADGDTGQAASVEDEFDMSALLGEDDAGDKRGRRGRGKQPKPEKQPRRGRRGKKQEAEPQPQQRKQDDDDDLGSLLDLLE